MMPHSDELSGTTNTTKEQQKFLNNCQIRFRLIMITENFKNKQTWRQMRRPIS